MNKKLVLLFSVIIVIIILVLISLADERFVLSDELKSKLHTNVKNEFHPGIIIGLVDSEGIRFYTNDTTISKDSDVLIDENTLFEIASITKLFTGLILADMVQREELNLDDPIKNFLPSYVKVPESNGTKITIEHLATHTSGLPIIPKGETWRTFYSSYTVEKMYEFLSNYELKSEPGTKYEYSNLGYSLLGHILSQNSGVSFEDLVFKKITSHIEMNNTKLQFPDDSELNIAVAYYENNPISIKPWNAPPGSGGFKSSAKDLTIFLLANMGMIETFTPDFFSFSHEPRFQYYNQTDFTKHMGLGWRVFGINDHQIFVHNGLTEGHSSFIGFSPEKQLGVIVLSNSEISNDYLGLHLLDESFPMLEFSLVEVDKEILKNLVGTYQSNDRKYVITYTEEKLWIKIGDEDKKRIYPESQTKFFFTDKNQKIEFSYDKKGQVNKLIWWYSITDSQSTGDPAEKIN